MRVAGVHVEGRTVWVDAGDLSISPLDVVTVRLKGEECTGIVLVGPDQLIRLVENVKGAITAVSPPDVSETSCSYLPGGDLPALGSWLSTGSASGIVTQLDAVHGILTLRTAQGEAVEVAIETELTHLHDR